jgi:glutaredoxin-related protein
MKKVAILQSNYIPWKGYFDMIATVDEFILYDDMQYTRRDWRNRNLIKTPKHLQWLTVPVSVKGKYFQKINETEIYGSNWAETHWKMLLQNYRRAQNYVSVADYLEPFYRDRSYTHLSELNRTLIQAVNDYLGIMTKISSSSDFRLVEGKTERLVDLCQQVGASEYISGPAAMNYIDPKIFESAGIKLTWFDYSDYPEYPQLWGEFQHGVSILDLLFNCGKDAPHFMKHVR